MTEMEIIPPENSGSGNSVAANKHAAVQFLRMIEEGRIDEAYRIHAAMDGRHHNPYSQAGFPALRDGMMASHVQFPDMRISMKNVIAEGDLVAVHSHVVLSPGETGIAVVHLFRFHTGRIVEFWDCGQPVPVDSPNKDGMF